MCTRFHGVSKWFFLGFYLNFTGFDWVWLVVTRLYMGVSRVKTSDPSRRPETQKKNKTKKQKAKKNTVPGNRQRSPAADWPIDPSRRGTRRSIVLHARRHQRRRPKQKQKKTKLKKKKQLTSGSTCQPPTRKGFYRVFFFYRFFFRLFLSFSFSLLWWLCWTTFWKKCRFLFFFNFCPRHSIGR